MCGSSECMPGEQIELNQMYFVAVFCWSMQSCPIFADIHTTPLHEVSTTVVIRLLFGEYACQLSIAGTKPLVNSL